MSLENFAITMAKEAGKILLENFGRKRLKTKVKEHHEIVSNVDKLTEDFMIQRIRELDMECIVLTEESGKIDLGGEEYMWIIDPLDATFNFLEGIPIFCTSIALQRGNHVVLGVIYDPNKREVFSAKKKGGAFLNQKKVNVGKKRKLENCGLLFEWGYSDREIEKALTILRKVAFSTREVRVFGCTALDMCYVACGRFEALIVTDAKPWDIAAGAFIVEEAGGIVTDIEAKPWTSSVDSVVASNEVIHSKLIKLLE